MEFIVLLHDIKQSYWYDPEINTLIWFVIWSAAGLMHICYCGVLFYRMLITSHEYRGSRAGVFGNQWVTWALLLQNWHKDTQWQCVLWIVHLRGERVTGSIEAYLPAELLSLEHHTAPRSTSHTWANTDLLACLFLNSNNNISFKGGSQFTGLVTQSGIRLKVTFQGKYNKVSTVGDHS